MSLLVLGFSSNMKLFLKLGSIREYAHTFKSIHGGSFGDCVWMGMNPTKIFTTFRAIMKFGILIYGNSNYYCNL